MGPEWSSVPALDRGAMTGPRPFDNVRGALRPFESATQGRSGVSAKTEPGAPPPTVATGVAGLDDILGGGLTPNRLYLIEGNPGSGKTTLALQLLLDGERRGERGLYVTLSETKDELHAVARSHGWSLDGIAICELIPSGDSLRPDSQP